MNQNEQSIGKWVSLLYRYGQCYISKRLKDYRIGSGQYIFLIALYTKDGVSQEEVSEHLKIDKATTAKALRKLEEEGYVRRGTNESDKRAYKVFLTEKGMEIKPFVQKALSDWTDILATGISEDERKTVIKLLETMSHNAILNVD